MHFKRQNRLRAQKIRKRTENLWQQPCWHRKKPGNGDDEMTGVKIETCLALTAHKVYQTGIVSVEYAIQYHSAT